MKKFYSFFLAYFLLQQFVLAQTNLIGAENFSINLPQDYKRTIGNNHLASVQWEHNELEIYGYLIFENIDELKIAEINTDLNSYTDLALKDFIDYENYKLIESKRYKTKNGKETICKLISYYNPDLDVTILLQLNSYATKNFIYKMINFGAEDTFSLNRQHVESISKNINLPK
jgi:hypothetical protein